MNSDHAGDAHPASTAVTKSGWATSEEAAADHADRIADALHVLHGERDRSGLRRVAYAVYLAALFGAFYGFTVAQAGLRLIDPEFFARLMVWPWAVPAGIGVVALALALVFRAGRVRGPVVPGMAYLDMVVASGIDRGLTLRPAARTVCAAGLGIGSVLGLLTGAAFAASGHGAVLALVLGGIGGLLIAAALLSAWFAGQVSLGAPLPRRLSQGLRALRITDLRAHAIRSIRLGGAALSGDLRAARLELATPVTRGRSARLRPGHRRLVVVRRDLLGLRRTPAALATGLVLAGLAAAGLAAALAGPGIPVLIPLIAAALGYLGVGTWSEGMRSVADQAGTNALFGMGFRAAAASHLLTPAGLFLLTGCGVGAAVTWAAGGSVLTWLAWLPGLTGILVGAVLLAAFRGAAPVTAFVPEFGPMSLVLWYARPLLVAAFGAGLLGARATQTGSLPGGLFAGVSGAALIGLGLWRARELELAHRQ